MPLHPKQTLLLISHDTDLKYLFGRFAEQCQYRLIAATENTSNNDVPVSELAAVIFSSTDMLDKAQDVAANLASFEVPVIVCASVTEQARAIELGADACLLHPITFEGFQSALASVSAPGLV